MTASPKSDSDALAVTRRIVGNSIASSMNIGTPSQKAAAWGLAAALDDNGVEVEGPVREALQRQGADFDEVWVRPVRPVRFSEDALLNHTARLVAMSMIHGDYSERDRAYDMVQELEQEAPGFTAQVKWFIAEAGKSPEVVWQLPKETPDESARRSVHPGELRSALARHISGAYISGNDHQHSRARELATALDQAGLNVDSQVDRLVLVEMRIKPSNRGEHGRPDSCPF